MSDIGLSIPWWFAIVFLGMMFWPVTLALGLTFLAAALLTRGLVRVCAGVLAIVLAADLVFAARIAIDHAVEDRKAYAFEARINQTLEHPLVVDGLALPAGTEVQWSNESRRHLRSANLPSPTPLLGLQLSFVSASDDGQGWDVQMPSPPKIDGWTCDTKGLVQVSAQGRLRSCTLATARGWQGWTLPAGSLLELTAPDGEVGLALPMGASLPAPEIGHAIPATGQFRFNADGSLHDVYFDGKDPLVVRGVPLWNEVTWTYDPVTIGQGRRRRPTAVSGAVSETTPNRPKGLTGLVSIRTTDGQITPTD